MERIMSRHTWPLKALRIVQDELILPALHVLTPWFPPLLLAGITLEFQEAMTHSFLWLCSLRHMDLPSPRVNISPHRMCKLHSTQHSRSDGYDSYYWDIRFEARSVHLLSSRFSGLPQSLQTKKSGQYNKIGHNSFISHSFQFNGTS
jgi:hypothetical protein